jgi:hypothetical protein
LLSHNFLNALFDVVHSFPPGLVKTNYRILSVC